jgi:hypothetical protein
LITSLATFSYNCSVFFFSLTEHHVRERRVDIADFLFDVGDLPYRLRERANTDLHISTSVFSSAISERDLECTVYALCLDAVAFGYEYARAKDVSRLCVDNSKA